MKALTMLRQLLLQLWKEQSNVTDVLVPLANLVTEISVKTPHALESL